MKKQFLYIALFFILTANFTIAQTLKWYSFNEGSQKAKKEGKILLVDYYTEWCGWCKKMDKDTYANADIIKYLNKNFVVVKLNPETDGDVTFEGKTYSAAEFTQMSNVSGYPATGFFTKKMEYITTVGGYHNAEKFKPILEKLVTELSKLK